MVFSRIPLAVHDSPVTEEDGTEKIWVSVVERRLKVLAPKPAISLRLRLRVLMRDRPMNYRTWLRDPCLRMRLPTMYPYLL